MLHTLHTLLAFCWMSHSLGLLHQAARLLGLHPALIKRVALAALGLGPRRLPLQQVCRRVGHILTVRFSQHSDAIVMPNVGLRAFVKVMLYLRIKSQFGHEEANRLPMASLMSIGAVLAVRTGAIVGVFNMHFVTWSRHCMHSCYSCAPVLCSL